MSEYEYSIGDWVRVSATADVDYHDGERRSVKRSECEPFEARIVGATHRQIGVYDGGRRHHFGFESLGSEAPSLIVSGSELVWLVRRELTNKAIDVLPEDLERIERDGPTPIRHAHQPPWNDECRKAYSEHAKHAPRDNKGRFLPLSECQHEAVRDNGYCRGCGRKQEVSA